MNRDYLKILVGHDNLATFMSRFVTNSLLLWWTLDHHGGH